jgi:hypothetical protein
MARLICTSRRETIDQSRTILSVNHTLVGARESERLNGMCRAASDTDTHAHRRLSIATHLLYGGIRSFNTRRRASDIETYWLGK